MLVQPGHNDRGLAFPEQISEGQVFIDCFSCPSHQGGARFLLLGLASPSLTTTMRRGRHTNGTAVY